MFAVFKLFNASSKALREFLLLLGTRYSDIHWQAYALLFITFPTIFQIRQLDEAAARLVQGHPDSADTIRSKQEEIHDEWTQLTAKANALKEKLLDSYDLQRFLSDYHYLTAWIQSMIGLVASDVTGAEALLERH